ALERLGISLDEVTEKVLADGVRLFEEAFAKLLAAVAEATGSLADRQTLALPDALRGVVEATLDQWDAGGKCRRLWRRDSSLWTGADESGWLGWLGIVDEQLRTRRSSRGSSVMRGK